MEVKGDALVDCLAKPAGLTKVMILTKPPKINLWTESKKPWSNIHIKNPAYNLEKEEWKKCDAPFT